MVFSPVEREAAAAAQEQREAAERRDRKRQDAAAASRHRARQWAEREKSLIARNQRQSETMLQSFAQCARGFINGSITIEELTVSLEGILQPGDNITKVGQLLTQMAEHLAPGLKKDALLDAADEYASGQRGRSQHQHEGEEDDTRGDSYPGLDGDVSPESERLRSKVAHKKARNATAGMLVQERLNHARSASNSNRRRQQQPRMAPGDGDGTVLLEMPDADERKKLFSRIDYNGNGALSLAEIDKAVLELWPGFNNKPALMRAYKSADANGDGFIKRREFRLLLKYIIYFNALWDKFEEIDSDGDRRLDLAEFIAGCEVVGHSMGRVEAVHEFAVMDENEGGFVLFDVRCYICS